MSWFNLIAICSVVPKSMCQLTFSTTLEIGFWIGWQPLRLVGVVLGYKWLICEKLIMWSFIVELFTVVMDVWV